MPPDNRTRKQRALDEHDAAEIEQAARQLRHWADEHAEWAIPVRPFRHLADVLSGLAVGVRSGHVHHAGATREALREFTRSIRRDGLPTVRMRSPTST